MAEKRISLPEKIESGKVAELRLTSSGTKLVSHAASKTVKALTGLPLEFTNQRLYSLKRHTKNATTHLNNAPPESDPLRKRRQEISDVLKNSVILRDLSQSKLQGFPNRPAFPLEVAGTDSAVLVAPSRAGKSTLTNAIARQTTFSPEEFKKAYHEVRVLKEGDSAKYTSSDMKPQIVFVDMKVNGRLQLGDGEDGDASSSDSDDSTGGNDGRGGRSLAFHETKANTVEEWVELVENDPDYVETLNDIQRSFAVNPCVSFRGPLLAVEENKASTMVPTAITASSKTAPFQFMLEIPFIGEAEILAAIGLLEDDRAAISRDPVEDARARDLFGLSGLGEERVKEKVGELKQGGWKLPGHWKFVIGRKLVWQYQARSFEVGAVAVHDFALKTLHGGWSFWPLVSLSGVQLSVPGNMPAIVDLPGIALDGSARDLLLPRYLLDFPANTYVFVVREDGQMEGDVRQLAHKEDFVRQALMLEQERRQGRQVEKVPPVLMFVSIFDRHVKWNYTEAEIHTMMKKEKFINNLKNGVCQNLRAILTDDGKDDEGRVLPPAEIDDLMDGAVESGLIQFQLVCTLRTNAGQEAMVSRLQENMRRAYNIQNDVWMSWLGKCGRLLFERQDYQEQLLRQTTDMHKRLTRVLRQFLGNSSSKSNVEEKVLAYLNPLTDLLDGCLKDALKQCTANNFRTWREQQGLTDNNASQQRRALSSAASALSSAASASSPMAQGNKLVAWLLTPIYRQLVYKFNGQLARYHQLPWVRQLACDITNIILPARVMGDASGLQGGAGVTGDGSQLQASTASSVSSGGSGGCQWGEDGGVVDLQRNRVCASVLQVLLDGIHAALSAITLEDLRVFGHNVAMMEDCFPQLAKSALEKYESQVGATHQRYNYLIARAKREVLTDTATNMGEAFQNYVDNWAKKAAWDIHDAVQKISDESIGYQNPRESQQFKEALEELREGLHKLNGGAAFQREEEAMVVPRPRARRTPAALQFINAEDRDALRQMAEEEFVRLPVDVCKQLLADLNIFPLQVIKAKRIARWRLFECLTKFFEQEDRQKRQRVG